jgi:L-lactate permease
MFHTSLLIFQKKMENHAHLVATLVMFIILNYFTSTLGYQLANFGTPWTILGSLLGTIGLIVCNFGAPWTMLTFEHHWGLF